LNSVFKTKAEEIEWRRSKILELKSQGLDQREIAQILKVSSGLISQDLQAMRKEAMENVREYTTKQYPLQLKVTLVGVQNIMKVLWKIIENSPDNKEKMQAIEHYRQCWTDMMVLLHPGGDVLELIVDKISKYNGNGNGKASSSQRLPNDGDIITPKNGFNPWIFQTNTRQTYQGER
jgi:predicted transcriptional regulator